MKGLPPSIDQEAIMHISCPELVLHTGDYEFESEVDFFISLVPEALSLPASVQEDVHIRVVGAPPRLPVGAELSGPGLALRVLANQWGPWSLQSPHSVWGILARTVTELPRNTQAPLVPRKNGLSLAWITLSDTCAAGGREDLSGPLMEECVRQALPVCHSQGFVLPDEPLRLRGLVADLALNQRFDLIVTSGGTGVGPRDTTPEALSMLFDKRLPGFEQAMLMASLQKTPHAMISRALAGAVGHSLVLTLPGSKKAVAENLEAVLPAVKHAIEKLQGDTTPCGG